MAQIYQYVVADNEDILFKVQKLASIARNSYLAEGNTSSSFGLLNLSEVEADNYSEQQSELFRFLNTLDEEQIKVVQAVMYIGRDYRVSEPSDEELEKYCEQRAEDPYFEFPELPLRAPDPDACLSEMVEELDQGKGWKDKFIEINIIMEKLMKLSDYLLRGFQILGLQ